MMDDAAMNKFFSAIDDAKRFLEGFGMPIDNKFGSTEVAFKDCVTIACCNRRPPVFDL
jgi:hypothetical protein